MNPQYSHESQISRQAWHIARLIDKLGPGNYTIHLSRPDSDYSRWTIEVLQPVTVVQKREVFDKAKEETRKAIE